MTNKCPCCNRAIRAKKPKAEETPEERFDRVIRKARANAMASLRKPMPLKTKYKEAAS